MTKAQRYKHEMLVRVRDFGAAHSELFPESSPGGEKFARIAAAVASIDEHMKNRSLGTAGSRGVKASTRTAVVTYMRTIAKAARRISREERSVIPFRMPRRKTLQGEVGSARAFLEEAKSREAQFIGMGLPPTFVSEFEALVNELSQAVDTRLNSKTMRGQAHTGIRSALRLGHDIVRDLDVVVEVATRQDPVVAGTWRVARRIEGQASSPTTKTVVAMPEVPPADQPVAEEPPTADATSPPAIVPLPAEPVTPTRPEDDVMGRAS